MEAFHIFWLSISHNPKNNLITPWINHSVIHRRTRRPVFSILLKTGPFLVHNLPTKSNQHKNTSTGFLARFVEPNQTAHLLHLSTLNFHRTKGINYRIHLRKRNHLAPYLLLSFPLRGVVLSGWYGTCRIEIVSAAAITIIAGKKRFNFPIWPPPPPWLVLLLFLVHNVLKSATMRWFRSKSPIIACAPLT